MVAVLSEWVVVVVVVAVLVAAVLSKMLDIPPRRSTRMT